MHPDKLGGYPDHVDRTFSEAHDPTFLNRSDLTSSSRSSARASRISRSRRLSFFGTTTPTCTMRFPFSAPFFFVLGAPAPLTLNCLPSCVPAGNFTFTVPPPGLGTSICAPSAASTKLTGTSTTKSSPRRLKTGCSSTSVLTYRSPAGPPLVPAFPLPGILTFILSLAPAGILTLTCLLLRTLPFPPHTEHGFSMILPSPPHPAHGVESAKNPWSRLCTPLPPHSGHVLGAVPGAAPVPPHSPHASSTGTPTRVVTTFRASLKLNLMFTVIFSPFALVLWVVPPARPKMSPRLPKPPSRSELSSKSAPPGCLCPAP